MKLNGRSVSLPQLRAEIIAAGIAIGDLDTAGDELVTRDADGHSVPTLPAGVAAVLAAHVVPPGPDMPDFGAEVPADAVYQFAARVVQARAFLDNPAPSNAAVVTALKLTIRVVLWLAARQIGRA